MDCKYFDGCLAMLCPKDEGVADRAWFTAHPVMTKEERGKFKAVAEKLNTKSLGFQDKKGVNPCALNGETQETGSWIPPTGNRA
jgi:hypothetical protein